MTPPSNFDNFDDEASLKKNRLKDIEPDEAKKRRPIQQKKAVIILTLIVAIAIIAIFIVVKFVYKKPDGFKPLPKEGALPFEGMEKELKTESENVHIKKGKESYAKGYFTDAIAEFNEVVESDATDKDKAIALTYLGMISDDRGDYKKAVEYYSRALTYDKNNADIYKNLSISYRHLKDFDKALKYAKEAYTLNPKDINSRILIGNIYFETGKYKEALDHYSSALELAPENSQLLYNIASSHMKLGDEFAAIEYFKKAGAADRIGEVAHRAFSRLGVIYTERRAFDLAEQYLKQAVSIRPSDPVNRYNLGIAYLKQNKKELALEEFTKAEEFGSKDATIMESIAEAYFSVKDFDRSLSAYQKLLGANQRNIKVLSRIAEIYYEKGELDRAFEAYKKITMIEPATENARVAYLNMGNILDDAQKFDEAIEAYKSSLAISSKDDSAYYNLGIAYKHAGKPELAIDSWKKAASLNESDPKPRLAIADYYYEKGFYDLAEKEYQIISSRWPDIQEAHFKMGTLYYKREKYQYALNAYKRVVELNEKNDMTRKAYVNMALLTSKLKSDEEGTREAIQYAQKALLIKADDPESLFSLGIIYAKREMHEKAIETFYQVLRGTNSSKLIADAYNHIGKSYYKEKQYKKAMQAFTRAVEEDPSSEEIRLNRKTAMQAYESELERSR